MQIGIGLAVGLGGETSVVPWYRAGGAPAPVAAWQPVGAVDIAAARVNLVNPGTYDLTDGSDPAFDTKKGFTFTGTQYLKTGVLPVNNQAWSMAIQVSGATTTAGEGYVLAMSPYSLEGLLLGFVGTTIQYQNGGRAQKTGNSLMNRCLLIAGTKAYLDGVDTGLTIPADTVHAWTQQLYMGAMNFAGSGPYGYGGGIFRTAAVWNQTLTDAQAIAVSGAMNGMVKGIVFEGDSMTAGTGVTSPYPTQCVALLSVYPDWWNVATSGNSLAMMVTQGTQTDPNYKANYGKNIAILWGGINDINGSHNTATLFGYITTWCAARKVAGFETMVLTIPPANYTGWSANMETDRLALNALIMGGDPSINIVSDIASLPNLQDPSNTTYFNVDQLHLTNAGYGDVASLVATKISQL